MENFRYIFLFIFITSCASTHTFLAYTMTQNVWVSVFITSAVAIFFILENMELNRLLQEKDHEINIMNRTTQITLIPKMIEVQQEIQALKEHITIIPTIPKERYGKLRLPRGVSPSK
jgi:hypothetical protein